LCLWRQEYYGTLRARDFDPDHWKTELSAAVLKEIYSDENCKNVIQNLNYPMEQ
jgi:hypothetical protein